MVVHLWRYDFSSYYFPIRLTSLFSVVTIFMLVCSKCSNLCHSVVVLVSCMCHRLVNLYLDNVLYNYYPSLLAILILVQFLSRT